MKHRVVLTLDENEMAALCGMAAGAGNLTLAEIVKRKVFDKHKCTTWPRCGCILQGRAKIDCGT